MTVIRIFEQVVQGDDVLVTIRTDEDVTGFDCVSRMEDYSRNTVAEFTPTVNEDNTIDLSLPGVDSASIPAGKYRWDVKVIDLEAQTRTVVKGIIEVLESA